MMIDEQLNFCLQWGANERSHHCEKMPKNDAYKVLKRAISPPNNLMRLIGVK